MPNTAIISRFLPQNNGEIHGYSAKAAGQGGAAKLPTAAPKRESFAFARLFFVKTTEIRLKS
ncbi:MAG TPA: hypothetical protein DEQ68_00360 [Ruminococcaceae bacterium]|nr:hypothetical protein [Oscillospiraceae bacterium]